MPFARPSARLLLFLLAGCATAAPTPTVVSTTDVPANEHVLARGLLPCLDATVARMDRLHAAGAPFSGADLQTMLLARLEIPENALKMIDTSRPIGFALVDRPGGGPAVATAFAPRGSDAALLAGSLGGKLFQQTDAVQVQLPDGGGSLWVRTIADASVVGASYEDVSLAGDEAAAARAWAVSAGDEAQVVAYPRAVARAAGVDLTAAPDAAVGQVLAAHDKTLGHRTPPAERAALEGVLRVLLPALADSDTVDATLSLGAERGLGLAVRATPRAGSGFAARVAAPARYQAPPSLASGEPTSVAAFGASVPLMPLLQAVLDAQARARVEGAAEVASGVRTLLGLLNGEVALGVRAGKAGLGYDLVLPLKTGAQPRAVLDAFGALGAGPSLAALLRASYGPGAPAVSVRREGTQVRADLAYGATSAGMVKAIHGGSTLTARARVADGRLLVAVDSDGGARLAALEKNSGAAPSEPLAAALAETQGREGFLFQDLWGLVRVVPAAAAAQKGGGASAAVMSQMFGRLLGFAQFPLPIYLSVAGGREQTIELRVPLLALKSAGSLLAMFGLGGARAQP